MVIVVDEDIPFAAQAFGRFGDARAMKAGDLRAGSVADADALVVRSVMRVDATLLRGSRVKFVGTATSGVDHIDRGYLRAQGIALADAAGANANAVAEYVVAALLHFRESRALRLEGASLGIVGFGHVGRRVARYVAALGLRCVVNDPPLGRSTCEPSYRTLEDALACDVVTVHVPLERGGADPTFHLINDRFLDAMKPGAVLLNTSRGAVANGAGLKRVVDSGRLGALVLDVWENEPAIDVGLAQRCTLATAHIAGHTLDAKIGCVAKLCTAFAAHIGSDISWSGVDETAAEPFTYTSLADAVRSAFDIGAADHRLRETLGLPAHGRAAAFDALRAGWPTRREFHVRPIDLEARHAQDAATASALGFRCTTLSAGGVR